MKTKAEIIDETVEYYSADVSRRAVDHRGSCFYRTPSGKSCAVGRCLDPEKYQPKMETIDAYENIRKFSDAIFKPEYQGHERDFWNDLQKLHDRFEFWNDEGLTGDGEGYLETIRREWCVE